MKLRLLIATALLSAVGASDLLDTARRGAYRQQDEGQDDYSYNTLQSFTAPQQEGGNDYDFADLEKYGAALQQEGDGDYDFADLEKYGAALQQEGDGDYDFADLEKYDAALQQEGDGDYDFADLEKYGAALQQEGDGDYDFAEVETHGAAPQDDDYDSVEDEEYDSELPSIMKDDLMRLQQGLEEDEPEIEVIMGTLQQDIETEKDLEPLIQQDGDGDEYDNEEPGRETALAAQDEGEEDEDGGTAVAQWNNRWDGPLRVVCPAGQGLYGVRSVHNNKREDRLFRWYCKRVYSGAQARRSTIQLLRRVRRRIRRRLRRYRRRIIRRVRRRRRLLRRCRRRATRLIRGRYRHLRHRLNLRYIKLRRHYNNLRRQLSRTRNSLRANYRRYLHYRRLYYRLLKMHKRLRRANRYNRHNKCFWRKANRWDQPMNFRCPSNFYLAGVASRHDNRRGDREWHGYCCHTRGVCTVSCRWSGYVNNWDGPMNYRTRNTITGLYSVHNKCKKDRRWKIFSCAMKKC